MFFRPNATRNVPKQDINNSANLEHHSTCPDSKEEIGNKNCQCKLLFVYSLEMQDINLVVSVQVLCFSATLIQAQYLHHSFPHSTS